MATKRGKCLAGHDSHPDCNLHCCAITPERAAEIRSQARSRNNWAALTPVRATAPVCLCGRSETFICPIHG